MYLKGSVYSISSLIFSVFIIAVIDILKCNFIDFSLENLRGGQMFNSLAKGSSLNQYQLNINDFPL